MVNGVRPVATILTTLSVAAIVVAGCASSQSNTPRATDHDATSRTATASRSPVSHKRPQVVVPAPGSLLACGDVSSDADAAQLVVQGEAEAFVKISITAAPGPVFDNTRTLAVADYQVLAGSLSSGGLQQIQEADQSDTNTLPPGAYAILVGATGTDGTYFLSDGVRGSFVLNGDDATQQCPDFDNPQSSAPSSDPVPSSSGVETVESLSQLTKLFEDAFTTSG